MPGAASVFSVRSALGAQLVVAFLFAIRVTAPREIAVADAVQDFITLSISVLVESLPFVMLGIGLGGGAALGAATGAFRHASNNAVSAARGPVFAWGDAACLRVRERAVSPRAGCSGIAVPDAITFLLGAPILNPITIVVTYQAFGFFPLIHRSALCD
jgi:uncharacterized protein